MGMLNYIPNKIREYSDKSNNASDQLKNSWQTFLSRSTYLTYDNKTYLNQESKHAMKCSKLPWYLFWHFPLRNNLKRSLMALKVVQEKIRLYNEEFVQERLSTHKSLFDGTDDGLKYPLDNNQRAAIVRDDKHTLVVAAAGSGKTSVIASKIAYLLRRKDVVKPEKILALAFTKVAAKEMQDRIKRDFGIDVKIATFHSFGRSLIIEKTKNPPKFLFDGENGEREFGKYVKKLFDLCLKDVSFQENLFEYLANYLDEEVDEATFEDKVEYFEYMRSKKYTTLANIAVHSVAERGIANFLFKNQIKFVYEPAAEWSDSDESHKQYRPDFYLPEYEIYIEHWGISRENKVPEWFTMSSEGYIEKMNWAKEQFKKHSKKLIELFSYEFTEGKLIENLKSKLLKEAMVTFKPLPYRELVEKTYQFKENTQEISFLIWSFIKLAKSNFLLPNDLKERLEDNSYTPKQILFAKLAIVVYELYQHELKKQNRMDFHDMINDAVNISKNLRNGYLEKYDYILIDEFQDISNQRLELIKCFVNSESKTKLFCVGDDWQSIYQFTGSEIQFFLKFGDIFPHPDISKLAINYRCSKSIVAMSSKLIANNKNQISKNVKSAGSDAGGLDLFILDDKSNYAEQRQRQHVFNKVKRLIADGVKPQEILVISRFNKSLGDLKIFCSARKLPVESGKQKGIRFYSAHKSKGTEAQHVFILDMVSGTYGFPCEIQDASVLRIAKNYSDGDNFEEERRLFYVALTRSKGNLYIYTRLKEQSVFLNEIRDFLIKNEVGFVEFDWKNQTRLIY